MIEEKVATPIVVSLLYKKVKGGMYEFDEEHLAQVLIGITTLLW